MNIREKQWLFASLVPVLITYMSMKGYKPVLGYVYRDEETQKRLVEKGASKTQNSNHLRCIAIDVELFNSEGKYLTKTSDHEQFGEYWESLHPLCRWGGRFSDGNHYSIEHNGVV